MTTAAPIPHFIVLGGFLGAGKTSAVRRLSEYLTEQGIRLGVITNDQANDLVDTQLLRDCGVPTREVAGGCFCCRFDQLMDAAHFLTSDVGPDVLVAEAVGSCTDLAATVTYPLRRLYGDRFTVAPLSVVVDIVRARQVLGLDAPVGGRFSPDVEYIYRKQLEEADIIVMNKCDLLPDEQVNELGIALGDAYPRADVIAVSTRDGLQLGDWFQQVLYGTQNRRPTMDVDYEMYAAGEERLGWVNATLSFEASRPSDAMAVLQEFFRQLQVGLDAAAAQVAHLKMTLAAGDGDGSLLASLQFAGAGTEPVVGTTRARPIAHGLVILNLRAESAPDELERAVWTAAGSTRGQDDSVALAVLSVDAFRPGRPVPTHRDVEP